MGKQQYLLLSLVLCAVFTQACEPEKNGERSRAPQTNDGQLKTENKTKSKQPETELTLAGNMQAIKVHRGSGEYFPKSVMDASLILLGCPSTPARYLKPEKAVEVPEETGCVLTVARLGESSEPIDVWGTGRKLSSKGETYFLINDVMVKAYVVATEEEEYSHKLHVDFSNSITEPRDSIRSTAVEFTSSLTDGNVAAGEEFTVAFKAEGQKIFSLLFDVRVSQGLSVSEVTYDSPADKRFEIKANDGIYNVGGLHVNFTDEVKGTIKFKVKGDVKKETKLAVSFYRESLLEQLHPNLIGKRYYYNLRMRDPALVLTVK